MVRDNLKRDKASTRRLWYLSINAHYEDETNQEAHAVLKIFSGATAAT
jgi:hypothetical protein